MIRRGVKLANTLAQICQSFKQLKNCGLIYIGMFARSLFVQKYLLKCFYFRASLLNFAESKSWKDRPNSLMFANFIHPQANHANHANLTEYSNPLVRIVIVRS